MHTLGRFPFLAIVTAAIANAQDGREPVRGSAVAADGSSWGGARVQLVSRPWPGDERVGQADEVVATTDDKGRFLVKLLPGRAYLAWASAELADGREQVSFALDDVLTGRPLELVADVPRARKRLRLEGAAAWRARGALQLTVLSATSPVLAHTLELATDEVTLPRLPGRGARLLVTSRGMPLQQWPVTIDLTTAGVEAMTLQAPRDVRVLVRDDAGAPLAGAMLSLGTIDPSGGERVVRAELGRTDAKGCAVVCLPVASERPFAWINYALGVAADGFAPVRNVTRVDVPPDHDAAKVPAITLDLPRGKHHELHVAAGDEPLTCPIVVRTAGASVGPGAGGMGATNELVRPDERGSFEVRCCTGAAVWLLAPAAALAVPSEPSWPLHPVALLGRIAGGQAAPSLTFDAAQLEPLRLQVVDGAGTPVPAAHLAVLVSGAPLADFLQNDGTPERVLTGLRSDRSGRVAALLPPRTQVTVVAWTADGFAVASRFAANEAKPTVLQLEPVRQVPGTVVGSDGKPLPFSRVQAYVSGESGADRALATALQLVTAATAPDGTFRLPLYPGLRYSLRGVQTPDGDHYLDQTWTNGRDEPDELHLDLRKAR